jgi:hypothetical protein
LNLAVWFGIHVLFPDGKMLDWFALVLSAVSFIGMLRWKWEVIPGSHRKWTYWFDLQGWPAPVILWKSHFP